MIGMVDRSVRAAVVEDADMVRRLDHVIIVSSRAAVVEEVAAAVAADADMAETAMEAEATVDMVETMAAAEVLAAVAIAMAAVAAAMVETMAEEIMEIVPPRAQTGGRITKLTASCAAETFSSLQKNITPNRNNK